MGAEEPAGEAEEPGGQERMNGGARERSGAAGARGRGTIREARRKVEGTMIDEKPMSILTCRFGSMDGWPTGTPVRTIGLLLLGRLLIGLGGMDWDVIRAFLAAAAAVPCCSSSPRRWEPGLEGWKRLEDERRRGMT
jgi:hypothetical protein